MSYPDNLVEAGFHDTSLVGASQSGSTIMFDIEFYTDDDVEGSTKVIVSGVEHIECEDGPLHRFTMMADHGSIITLERNGSDIVLVLVWVDFRAKTRVTCFYRFSGTTLGLVTRTRAPGPS